MNYIAGALSVSFRDYVFALVAILPGTVLYVFLGASAGSLTDSMSSGQDSTVTIVVVVVGILFGVLAICLTTRYARKELNRLLEERRTSENEAVADARTNSAQCPTTGTDENVESLVLNEC